MRLRKLELKDAPLMLEWMQDASVVRYMQTNFGDKSIRDCQEFIRNSWEDQQNLHMAVVDESDTYMGTVSLKNMDGHQGEFAIAVRKSAMGKGYASYAMSEIMKIGAKEREVRRVFWYVASDNVRALRFYDKNGYERRDGQVDANGFIWYEKAFTIE